MSEFAGIPPWLRSFFLKVVKRCAGALVAWIDEMNAATKEETVVGNGRGGYNGR